MPADHSARGTGRIQQDAVVRPPIPPALQVRCIRRDDRRAEALPGQVLIDPRKALGFDVQRGDVRTGPEQLEQVTGLAAGCGAGIEHPAAITREQPGRSQLGAGVLDRHQPVCKAGQVIDRHGLVEPDCLGGSGQQFAGRLFIRRHGRQSFEVGLCGRLRRVDPQPHRRALVVRRDDLLPLLWPIATQPIDQPLRVVVRGRFVSRLTGSDIPARKISQHGIDQARIFRSAQQASRLDGHRYRGVIGHARIGQLEKADRQQRLDNPVAFLEWPLQQHPNLLAEPEVMPQSAVRKHAQHRPVFRPDLLFR